MSRFFQVLLFFSFASHALLDAAIRRTTLATLTSSQWAFYVGSLVFEWLLILTGVFYLRQILAACKLRWQASTGVIVLLGLVASFAWISSWGFYFYFNTLPGVFAFSYLLTEPNDFFSLLGDGVGMLQVIGLTASALLWGCALHFRMHTISTFDRKFSTNAVFRRTIKFILLCLILVMNNNTRISPGVALPVTDALFGFKMALVRKFSGQQSWVRLQPRVPGGALSPIEKRPEFNVLLIVNESLRRANLGYYGYRMPAKDGGTMSTTPNLDRIFSSGVYFPVRFSRAFSNATMTAVSVPSVLTGISPAQGFDTMHRSYVIYEQVKRLQDVHTALITSHSYVTGNYRAFMNSSSLDFLWYRETGGLPAYNNVGADDRTILDPTKDFLSKHAEQPFFAVLHLNGTHYPYKVPPEFNFDGALDPKDDATGVDLYNRSIGYLDANTAQIFDILNHLKLVDNTIIIMTSDHGESFGEDGTTGHFGKFTLWNSNIPMAFLFPNKLLQRNPELARYAAGLAAANSNLVSNADLFPSILAMYGIPFDPAAYPGANLASLQSAEQSAVAAKQRPVVLYNLVDTGVKSSHLGVFWGDKALVVTRKEGSGTYEVHMHDYTLDPEAKKNIWHEQSADDRSLWRGVIEKFPLVADYAKPLLLNSPP